ncbi:malto-oligosyltrehalose trehalohydrolase [Zavarzinia sp. CC-PAN008]|uniref:malto-oligosyltrehalose trehalohydrolase n=1 Tax=Zavarzinia sp. CC-PAN008 TaxID=3243332 RepID=UPI003F74768A
MIAEPPPAVLAMPFAHGPHRAADGTLVFRLWAPAARSVDLLLDEAAPRPMPAVGDGWYEVGMPDVADGALYRFRIDGGPVVADPASRFQPQGVMGPSQVWTTPFSWQNDGWTGRPWHEAVILEAHVGTFSEAGSYAGVMAHLEHLVATGVTVLELMPLAAFAGKRGWGYDGVLPYAPHHAYGTPDALRRLVDAAHGLGLMVMLDVVYNHFGPSGNFLHQYAPAFFTERHTTPWGAAIDYTQAPVRGFAVENALHWLRDFRFDGLRLDAVHAIPEPGEPHLLEDLSRAVGALAQETGRHIHLVLENDDNVAHLLDPAVSVPAGGYRAQWNDDHHHAWHVLLTGEDRGYYADYAEGPGQLLARTLSSGFAYQGEASAHRNGVPRGQPSAHLPPAAFVHFLQNHDQIGNRALGDRLEHLAPAEAVAAALAVLLLAPQPPMLFMGEEWGTRKPFPYFCDFDGDLADAVRQGRAREFAAFMDQLPTGTVLPDALAESTFRSAVLDWSERLEPRHQARLDLVRGLLSARHAHLVPRLSGDAAGEEARMCPDRVLCARWRLGDGSGLHLVANLGDQARIWADPAPPGQPLWGTWPEPGAVLAPWQVAWRLDPT